jgi:hypothetical protein
MDSPEFDQFGSYQFSRLRPAKEKAGLGFTWHFPVMTVLSVSGLLGGSKWAVNEIEKGNFLPGRIMAFSVLGVAIAAYIAAVVSLVQQRRKRITEMPTLPPGYPIDAIACRIRILAANSSILIADGWIWVDQDLLVFRGDCFDFALRPRDFHKTVDVKKLSASKLVRFLAPKGFGPLSMRIVTPVSDRLAPELSRKLESRLGEWRRAATTSRPSLFPPFAVVDSAKRNPVTGNTKKFILGIGVAMVVCGLFGFLTQLLFKDYLEQTNPFMFALAFALLPSTFLFAVLGEIAQGKSRRLAIEKLKASGRVEMV